MNKPGRNDPCPCGSGKKYKKCCINHAVEVSENNVLLPQKKKLSTKEHYLSQNIQFNYGTSQVNEYFFDKNSISELSAQQMRYHSLIYPEIDTIASNFTNEIIFRAKDELLDIQKCDSLKQLIKIMIHHPDILNFNAIKKQFKLFGDNGYQELLKEMYHDHNDVFFQLSTSILHESGKDYGIQLIDIIENGERRAYVISLLCIQLGFSKCEEAEQTNWNYYHYFKEKYSSESYQEGPLLGLSELFDMK